MWGWARCWQLANCALAAVLVWWVPGSTTLLNLCLGLQPIALPNYNLGSLALAGLQPWGHGGA